MWTIRSIFLLLFLLTGTSALADIATQSKNSVATWIGPYQVDEIAIGPKLIEIGKTTGFDNPFGCNKNQWILIKNNDSFVENALKALLIAKQNKYQVKYLIKGCTTGKEYLNGVSLSIQ
jgi:hypothetical protein